MASDIVLFGWQVSNNISENPSSSIFSSAEYGGGSFLLWPDDTLFWLCNLKMDVSGFYETYLTVLKPVRPDCAVYFDSLWNLHVE